jgi:hypothetical protein
VDFGAFSTVTGYSNIPEVNMYSNLMSVGTSRRGSSVAQEMELEASKERGGILTLEQASARAKKNQNTIDDMVEGADLLKRVLINGGQFKEGTKRNSVVESIKKNGKGSLDKLTGTELTTALTELEQCAATVTKGGESIGAGDCFIQGNKKQLMARMNNGITYVQSKLMDVADVLFILEETNGAETKGKETKEMMTPVQPVKGESGAAEEEEKEEEQQGVMGGDGGENRRMKNRRMMYFKCKNELGYLMEVLKAVDSETPLGDDLIEALNEFETMKVIRDRCREAERYVLGLLITCCDVGYVKGKITDALEGKLERVVDTLSHQLGLKCDVAHVLAVITTQQATVTSENYIALCEDVARFEINPRILKTKNLGAQLVEYQELRKEADMMLERLKIGVDAGRFTGIECHMKSEFWGMRALFRPGRLESKAGNSENFKLIQWQVNDMNNRINLFNEGSDRERARAIENMAKSIDDEVNYVSDSKKGVAADDVVLATAVTKVANKKLTFKDNDRCIEHLRNGYCKKENCRFKVYNPMEYAARQDCKQYHKEGKCDNGRRCPRRHRDDPKELTDELMKKCVHFGRVHLVEADGAGGGDDAGGGGGGKFLGNLLD